MQRPMVQHFVAAIACVALVGSVTAMAWGGPDRNPVSPPQNLDLGGLVPAKSGRTVAVGCTDNQREFAVARFTAEGELDRSFGQGGIVRVQGALHNPSVACSYDATVLPNGDVLAAGLRGARGKFGLAVIKVNTEGRVDQNFGSGGMALLSRKLVYISAGFSRSRVALAGLDRSTNELVSAEFDLKGRLIPSYGDAGIATTSLGVDDSSYSSAALGPDGKLIIAGLAREPAASPDQAFVKGFVARVGLDGGLDASFGSGGIFWARSTIAIDKVQFGGPTRILALAGQCGPGRYFDPCLLRLKPDGTLDSKFGKAGQAKLRHPLSFGTVGSVATDSRGRYVVSASTTGGHLTLQRLNHRGATIRSFGADGIRILPGVVPNGVGTQDVLARNDGTTIFGGELPRTGVFGLGRLRADGSLDQSFGGWNTGGG